MIHECSYDDAFRITGIVDAQDATRSWTYGYDGLDRLTSATRTGQTQGWTYDANGNRLTETGTAPSTFTVSSTSNHLNTVSGTLSRTYAYDAAGNTLADGTRTFAYNDAGRMATYVRSGVTTTESYNALGQRVTKSNLGGTHYFVYDEAGHLIGEYDGAGTLFQETVWLGDIPIAALWPNGSGGVTVTYIHTDHLNTPRAITRTTDNAVLWRWRSDPFGTDLAEEDVDGDTVMLRYYPRFPGQFYDDSSGLHYNYFRDYDPQIGRYVESDPIGLKGGLNTYLYVGANPIGFADPLGLAAGVGLQVCDAYLSQHQRYKCRYYLAAYVICRTADYNPIFRRDPAANRGSLRCVRECLVKEDQAAHDRRNANCKDGCLADSEIDDYHRTCFTRCGLNPNTYPGVGPLN